MKNKKFVIFALLSGLVLVTLLFLKSSSASTSIIWKLTSEGTRFFPLVSIAALIDSINPCAFSILLLTIAFLFSLNASRRSILKIGVAYVFGIFVAYLAIGLGILNALHIFNTPHFMGKLGAAILIIAGSINLINEFFPGFPVKLKIPSAIHSKIAELMDKASVPAVFLLGALVGLCEFPCTGGPYLMILGLLHDQQTLFRGFWYLVWYNILFVLPLVIALFIASDNLVLDKLQSWRKNNLSKMRFVSGIVMVALGILIFFL